MARESPTQRGTMGGSNLGEKSESRVELKSRGTVSAGTRAEGEPGASAGCGEGPEAEGGSSLWVQHVRHRTLTGSLGGKLEAVREGRRRGFWEGEGGWCPLA